MQVVHLISGLGADRTAFGALGKFTELKLNFVGWIPNAKDETLNNYASRLIEIHGIKSNDIAIGLSFGGLVALEIAKHLNLEQVVLISSFKDKEDLKPIFENLLKLGFHRLIPNVKLNSMNSLIRRMFNTTSKKGRLVLDEMLASTDVKLTKWSIQKINESKFETRTRTRTKIHNLIGDEDKLVKLWMNESTYVVEGGGHFMVFENAVEITKMLSQILKT